MPAPLDERLAERAALRLAFAVAASLTWAQAIDLEVSFIAPLVAAALAPLPRVPIAALLGLPVIAFGLLVAVVVMTEVLGAMPAAMAVAMFLAFLTGFRLARVARLGAVAILVLVFFAVLPDILLKAGELTDDIVGWIVRNVAIAAVSVLVAGWLFPGGAIAAPRTLRPPIAPAAAAAALLLAAWLAWVLDPPAPGAFLLSVLLMLKADGEPPDRVGRNRLYAALVGGGLAVAFEALTSFAPSLLVLPFVVLALSWPLARRIARGGPARAMWAKSLNAFLILSGQDMSVFYEDSQERLGIRIAGVMLGLLFALLALQLLTRRTGAAPTQPLRAA
jgi:hypothetical protein